MVDGFAADAALPIGVAGGVGHDAGSPLRTDGDVFACAGGESVVAGDAADGGAEFGLVGGDDRARLKLRGSSEDKRSENGKEAQFHFQPSQSFPSAQSQRR